MLPTPGAAVVDLRDRLLSDFDLWLPGRVIDGVLRGYLERYGVCTDDPAPLRLQAVERATRVALSARVSSCQRQASPVASAG